MALPTAEEVRAAYRSTGVVPKASVLGSKQSGVACAIGVKLIVDGYSGRRLTTELEAHFGAAYGVIVAYEHGFDDAMLGTHCKPTSHHSQDIFAAYDLGYSIGLEYAPTEQQNAVGGE